MIDGFMTTNFALSLSFDGIRLLQRVADGWYLVGDVVLDSADLKGDLADLREKALSLDPSGLRCKILIPEEQIKYITLETAQTDINDVMEVLEGATPYAIKDLVIDFDCNGGRTFIAAVAREGGEVIAEASLVDRSNGTADLGVPFFPLIRLDVPSYDADNLPAELQAIPAIKPGSRKEAA